MATAPKANPKVVPIDEAPAAAPKKSKKMLLIAASALLVLGAGGGAWFFMHGGGHEGDAKESKQEPAKPPVFLALEPFTINLQQENGDQYLQVALTLQVGDEMQVEPIKLYMPLVRSRILLLLAGKKPSDLASIEGKEKLQKEIVEQVKKPFAPKGKPQEVSAVFFTSFVIQ
jgi:flagellar FliL protein